MLLRNATCEALDQVLVLIEVSRDHYNQTPVSALSPIGKHVRHIIDHLWAFQKGVDNGCIDYNLRHRDTALERDPELAIAALNAFIQWLQPCVLPRHDITVISEISVSGCEVTEVTSSLERELAYLINHTLHHVAYASLLANNIGITTPEHLGVAPATATYLRSQESVGCAP